MFQLQSILEDHERLKESREKKAREKAEKEAKRLAELQVKIGSMEGILVNEEVQISPYSHARPRFPSSSCVLQAMKEGEVKKPGFQRLRASQYDELRRQLATGGTTIPSNQV